MALIDNISGGPFFSETECRRGIATSVGDLCLLCGLAAENSTVTESEMDTEVDTDRDSIVDRWMMFHFAFRT